MQTLPVPTQQAMPAGRGSAPAIDQGKDEDYYDITRLRRQWNDWASAKDAEGREMVESRHYYHGDQWTETEIAALRRRKQPVVTSNRIVRKIDAVVGLVERLRQDPKAYARTPKHDEGAELATATLRFVLDNNDWKSKSSRIARAGGIDGISGIEYDLVPGDEGDPSLEMHIAYGDGFFYDPRSVDEGFTDARYLGIAKWVDLEQAKEMFPKKADEIDGLMESGADQTAVVETDRSRNWINTNEKKVRLADHWYILGGKWRWCMYIGTVMLKQGISPFIDEKGKTFPRYRMYSASVDHDGDRYGFVRNLKSPQDEVNHRRSKALHILNTKQIILEKGAVDDIEVTRRERARPDGIIEKNPGMELEFPDATVDFKGQLEMLQEAKNEIENFGPNPALIGQGLEDSSGRAIQLLQQAGIAELGPYLSAYKNWKLRVYRDIWNIIQRYWTAERWIRVTDDRNVAQFFQINKQGLDEYGRPAIVNAIGSLDVDIIIDEGPDAVNMQGDSMMVLQSLGPQFAAQFPDVVLELSPLPNSVKKPMLDKIKAKQEAPPPVDPKVAAQGQLKQMELAADAQATVADNSLEWRKAQLQALTQIEVARIGAKTDQDSASLAARLEAVLGFAQMNHEHAQNAQDRAHEAIQNDAERRQTEVLAARQQASEAAQQPQAAE
ncbi:hypothetical protein [Bradyrhizobium sp. LA2.1]|uniref:portal protein n=1 Tax=Bradyrhizobium sp. LA2.1 TaxID=3156376 RepID=UPI0033991383